MSESLELLEKTHKNINNVFLRTLVLFKNTIEQIKEGKLNEEETVELLQNILEIFVTIHNQLEINDFLKRVLNKKEEVR